MHALEELDIAEDNAGLVRIVWRCECGKRGAGTTRPRAVQGFKSHARAAARKDY